MSKKYESSAFELAFDFEGRRRILMFKYESSMLEAYEIFKKLGLNPAIISE